MILPNGRQALIEKLKNRNYEKDFIHNHSGISECRFIVVFL